MNAFRDHRYFIKVLFGCSLAHIIHPELLFFWVHPLFCIKLRGQHLYLAVAERSSSHPKTNKYWGLVWLFLALNTNYIWLYSWNWVKNLLRPFWTHLVIRSPGSWAPFEIWVNILKFGRTCNGLVWFCIQGKFWQFKRGVGYIQAKIASICINNLHILSTTSILFPYNLRFLLCSENP